MYFVYMRPKKCHVKINADIENEYFYTFIWFLQPFARNDDITMENVLRTFLIFELPLSRVYTLLRNYTTGRLCNANIWNLDSRKSYSGKI